MKKYLVSTYGEVHFTISAKSSASAKLRLNKMFAKDLPRSPLCGVPLTRAVTCTGYEIIDPSFTRIIDYEDDPRGVLEH